MCLVFTRSHCIRNCWKHNISYENLIQKVSIVMKQTNGIKLDYFVLYYHFKMDVLCHYWDPFRHGSAHEYHRQFLSPFLNQFFPFNDSKSTFSCLLIFLFSGDILVTQRTYILYINNNFFHKCWFCISSKCKDHITLI